MKRHTVAIIFSTIILFSCNYYNEEELYGNEICDTSNITYDEDIKPILQQNCYYCHSSSVVYSGNLNLENPEHIRRVVDNGKLLKNIKHEADGDPMPQGGAKLSDCKINKIEKWINLGTPYK
ncbi:MAG: hypothetical protein P1P88_22250 [Bacteroidales bacterium]|nr:hypothetical protein [Bacteroidales bacterium]